MMAHTEFGKYLVKAGLLSQEKCLQVLSNREAIGGRMDTAILDMGLINEETLLKALGSFNRTRTVSAHDLADIKRDLVGLIAPRMAKRYEIVPFRKEGKTLYIASLNPGDLEVEEELGIMTGCLISTFVGLEVRVYEALAKYYRARRSTQLVAISKRLAGGGPAQKAAPVRPKRKATKKKDALPTGLPRRRKTPQAEDEVELEISDEDLALFPSLQVDFEAEEELAEQEPAEEEQAEEDIDTEVEDEEMEIPFDATPAERLAAAAAALQAAEMREDVADVLLKFCSPYLRRRVLLTVRKSNVIGWRAEGEGIDLEMVRAVVIPTSSPSLFLSLTQGTNFWLGSIPPAATNVDLIVGLGGKQPPDCIVLPVLLRSKAVCFLYGDNIDRPVGGLPLAEMRRLVAKASLAFEVYLLKSKIRTI